MNTVTILVMAPLLGEDLSFITDVDPRLRALDGNAAYQAELIAEGLQTLVPTEADGPPLTAEERDSLFAQADVLLLGYPALTKIATRSPRLRWVHHTQAGVSNLWRSDFWASEITLTSSRGFVAPTAIAEYVIAGVLFFSRGLFDALLDKRNGRLDRSHYRTGGLRGPPSASWGWAVSAKRSLVSPACSPCGWWPPAVPFKPLSGT